LVDDLSLFGDVRIATAANADILIRDFVEQPDLSNTDFLTKLRGQLSASPPGAIQLAAELLYVHLLIARSTTVSGRRKAELVRTVLGFGGGEGELPADFAAALESGLINPGQGFNSYRWRQFGYLIEAYAAMKRLPVAERQRVVDDPHALVAQLDRIDDKGAAIQRFSLEHLLLPDSFAPVVSQDHRRQILKHWAGPESEPKSVRLAAVTNALAPNTRWGGEEFVNLYRAPYRWEWDTVGPKWAALVSWGKRVQDSIDLAVKERQYKLDSAKRLRAARETADSEERRTAIKDAIRAVNLVGWRVSEPFLKWLDDDPDALTVLEKLWTDADVTSVDRFLAKLPESAATGVGARLSLASVLLGAVDSIKFPPWRAQATDTAYRLVSHSKPEPSATEGERYETYLVFLDQVIDAFRRNGIVLADRLDAQSLVWALATYDPPPEWSEDEKQAFREWRRGAGALPPVPVQPTPTERELSEVAADLHLDEPFLSDVIQLLTDKKQVIFQGPPGTGKTYVARKLAAHFTGSQDRVRLVQFHPSYSYEDFVEGFRPRAGGDFELVHGPLLEMADRARKAPDEKFVLVIDELNRGNVARVFGELYFLLEYRDEPARLLYQREDFALPANLFLIGTMNTADKSIALLDSALRRRFYFVDFRPDEGPVAEVLRRYLKKHHPAFEWVADAVVLANKRVGDPAAAIGPSHFMRDVLDESWLQRAWDHAVLPTLADFFHGDQGRLTELELDRLRSEVTPPNDNAPPS
jgi:MoxR-like ATPase